MRVYNNVAVYTISEKTYKFISILSIPSGLYRNDPSFIRIWVIMFDESVESRAWHAYSVVQSFTHLLKCLLIVWGLNYVPQLSRSKYCNQLFSFIMIGHNVSRFFKPPTELIHYYALRT